MVKTKQITQAQFDERFYTRDDLMNSTSKNQFFPSVTHLLDVLPTPPQLVTWYKDKGHEATKIFKDAARKGTFVHNNIEQLILEGTLDMDNLQFQLDLERACPDPKDQAFVRRCFAGVMDWINDMMEEHEDFQILETECALFGKDYAGTVDLYVLMGGKYYIVDFKTSAAINQKHEIQVEAYRRAKGADFGGVLRLGASKANCKKYTFSVAKLRRNKITYGRYSHMPRQYFI